MKKNLLKFAMLLLPLAAGEWTRERGNAEGTGNNDLVSPRGRNLYFTALADSELGAPSVAEGMAYFGTVRGWIYGVDQETGELRLKKRASSNGISPLLATRQHLYYVDGDRIVMALRATGVTLFESPFLDDPVRSRLALASGTLCVQGPSKRALFRTNDLSVIREEAAVGAGGGAPHPVGSDVLFFEARSGASNAGVWLDLAAGDRKGEFPVRKGARVSSPSFASGRLAFCVDDSLSILSLSNGAVETTPLPSSFATSPVRWESGAVVGLSNGSLAVVENGTLRLIQGPSSPPAALVLIRDVAYLLSRSSPPRVTGFDLASGKSVYEYASPEGGAAESFVIDGGRLVLAIDRRLESAGPDGRAWLGSDARIDMSRDLAPRVWVVTNRGVSIVTQVVAPRWETNRGKDVEEEVAYNFFGPTGEGDVVKRKAGSTNVVTNAWVAFATNRQEVNLRTWGRRKRKEVTTASLSLKVIDERSNAVAGARISLTTRNGDQVLDSREVQEGESLSSLVVPRAGDTEVLASVEGYLDNKAVVSSEEKKQGIRRTLMLSKIETGKSIVVENILFDVGKSSLLPESMGILDRIRDTLTAAPRLSVEVRGFTDNTGDDQLNRRLSQSRADAVRDYLVKNGAHPERLSARGMGSSNPIADNKTEEGKAKNRRTEFYILKY